MEVVEMEPQQSQRQGHRQEQKLQKWMRQKQPWLQSMREQQMVVAAVVALTVVSQRTWVQILATPLEWQPLDCWFELLLLHLDLDFDLVPGHAQSTNLLCCPVTTHSY